MEIWKAIVGFENMYEVSGLGRVRSVPRLDSRGYKHKGKVLHLHPQKPRGYRSVMLYTCSKGYKRWVHRLVLEAFKGAAPAGQQGRHLNGRASDNKLSNLAWGTPAENAADKLLHGTHLKGSRVGSSKFTEKDIRRIVDLHNKGCSYTQIRNTIGASIAHISNVINGKVWKHLELT